MSEQQYDDPELEQVFNKINKVFQEHPDVGGFIAVHNREGGRFQPFFPAWTTATFRQKGADGMALHFKVDVNPDSVDNQDTVSMLLGLHQVCLKASAIWFNVAGGLAKHTGINLATLGFPEKPSKPTPLDY